MKEQYLSFFANLNRLSTGERAALKRCAGTMLQDADGKAMTAFYRCLPPFVDERQADRWFTVACLRCLWDAGEENGVPFEKRLGQLLRDDALSDSTAHRIESLLDTDWDNDGYMLGKLVRLIKMIRQKNGAEIDFGALLDDLIHWNADTQYVQRKWARAVFAGADADNEKGEN